MGCLPRSRSEAAGSLPEGRRIRVSKTDKTRPWQIQEKDVPGLRPVHGCGYHRNTFRSYPCDLPENPWAHENTLCTWEAAHVFIDGRKTYSETRYRQSCRRRWYRADRTAQRAIARSLTRDANSGGEIDEDVIDNRVAGPYALYGGGWWD